MMDQLKTMESFGMEEGKLGQQFFGGFMGAMSGARGEDDKKLLEALMMETGREGCHYMGVPLRLDGVAVGSICVFYRSDSSEVSPAEAALPPPRAILDPRGHPSRMITVYVCTDGSVGEWNASILQRA